MNILLEIYIEYIIIENFIVNFFLILFINIFTKQKINILRIIFTDLITTVYIVVANIYKLDNAFYKFLLSFVTVFIAFGIKDLKKYIKVVIYYYLIYFEYIGVILSITLIFNFNINFIVIKIIVYLISALIVYCFNKFLWKLWKVDIKNKDLSLKICINEVNLKAFVDTGNSVKMENGFPVIFVKNSLKTKIIKDKYKTKGSINISTISDKNKMDVYLVENVLFINNKVTKKTNTNLIFSKMLENSEYDALISYDTYIDKLEGGYL